MLSRVANCLYWMSRSIERAENIARIVDVNLQLLLDFRSLDDRRLAEYWMPIVQCTGDEGAFQQYHPKATGASVTEFLIFQLENPNSLVSSICQARENARMVRDQITVELWEELNRLYLFVRSPQARQVWNRSPSEFFQQIKASTLQLIGLTFATLIRNEGWWFTQVGKLIERADKTSRILDVRHQTLPARGAPDAISQTEALEWSAILRSCSAWDAYKSIYGVEVHPRWVAELLLLNEDFPRSVRFCVTELNRALRGISGVPDGRCCNEAERRAGRLVAQLQFSTIDEIFEPGLHDYLDRLQIQLNAIGDALFNAYIFQPFSNLEDEIMVQQEEQQQQCGPAPSSRRAHAVSSTETSRPMSSTPPPEPTPAPLPGGELSKWAFSKAPLLGGAGGGFRSSVREVLVSGNSLPGLRPRILRVEFLESTRFRPALHVVREPMKSRRPEQRVLRVAGLQSTLAAVASSSRVSVAAAAPTPHPDPLPRGEGDLRRRTGTIPES